LEVQESSSLRASRRGHHSEEISSNGWLLTQSQQLWQMIFASIVTMRIARLAQSSSSRNGRERLRLCASSPQIAFALRHGDPARRHRIECLSAIPKGILTTEESVVKAENITCHNGVLRRSTCGCSRYWPDWVPGTLKRRHPDTKREARNDWGVTDQDFNNGSHLAGAASHIFFDLLQERLCMAATLDRGQAHSYWPAIQR
jgi:hypothetical protein